jgi:hypothetical protein
MWKMIAFASRYGHQPILAMLGPLTVERVRAFSEAIAEYLKVERRDPTNRGEE